MSTPYHPPFAITAHQVTLVAELFDVSVDNVGLHLKIICEDAELSREATTEESSVVQFEGTCDVQQTHLNWSAAGVTTETRPEKRINRCTRSQ
jgi:hypothetical protein